MDLKIVKMARYSKEPRPKLVTNHDIHKQRFKGCSIFKAVLKPVHSCQLFSGHVLLTFSCSGCAVFVTNHDTDMRK
jgi:hypothetical protein